MPSPVTIGERIILYLAQYSKYKDDFDAPIDVSQDGIAEALRISRAHAAIEVKKLKEMALVDERVSHIRRGSTKRKVYYLNEAGENKAKSLRSYAEREGIQIRPLLDLRKCQGPELWESIAPEHRPVLAQACVFRKPFRRAALPATSISLLPEDKNGMVDIPAVLRTSIPALAEKQKMKEYHSFAADYWLREGDNRERLYHLIMSGRTLEAEMMIAAKGQLLLAGTDSDLSSILLSITNPREKYAPAIWEVQGEAARINRQFDEAISLADKLESLSDVDKRRKGVLLKARTLLDKNELEQSITAFRTARSISSLNDPMLECDMAEALTRAGRFDEAKRTLEDLISHDVKGMDPDVLEHIYFQFGSTCLRSGKGMESVRYLSKALGLARSGDKTRIYQCMSQSYASINMPEKAAEYAKKAGIRAAGSA